MDGKRRTRSRTDLGGLVSRPGILNERQATGVTEFVVNMADGDSEGGDRTSAHVPSDLFLDPARSENALCRLGGFTCG